MPLPRLRRVARSRSRDDVDWGTSSPAAIMHPLPPTAGTSGTSASVPSSSGVVRSEAGTDGGASSSLNRGNNERKATVDGGDNRGSIAAIKKVMPSSTAPTSSNRGEQHPIAEAFAKFQQQELRSYTNTFSPRCVISFYFAVAVLFLPLGAAILAGTANTRSYGPREYGNEVRIGENGTMKFTVNRRIRNPSYFYYSLDNYHQNARDYVKSRSDVMNMGKVPKAKIDIENCDRHLCVGGGDKCLRDDTGGLNTEKFVYPCGLTAVSFFSDTFSLCKVGGPEGCQDVLWSDEEIAWWTDLKYKFNEGEAEVFKRRNKDILDKTANELLIDPHFVVWMRLSAFSKFLKLYAVIKEDLVPGQYRVNIKNRYDVSGFKGKKYIFITETRWFGDSNSFLGTSYLVVGVIALFVAIFLLTKHMSSSSTPTHIDTATLLREHLATYENDPPGASGGNMPAPARQALHLGWS